MRHSRATTVAICGTATETIARVTAALADAGVGVLPVPPVAGVIGDARARRAIARAFAGAPRIDAVIICPALPATTARRRGGPDFTATIDTALKSTFFLAKHALLRLGVARRGTLVVVLPEVRPDAGVPARVALDALDCMVEALARAAPRGVRVGGVSAAAPTGRGAATAARKLAAAIRLLVDEGAGGPLRAGLRG